MLRPMPIEPIPPETARVARAAFPKGNRYLRVADELDTLFMDEALMGLLPTHELIPLLTDEPRDESSPWRETR
jgi:transposase